MNEEDSENKLGDEIIDDDDEELLVDDGELNARMAVCR